MNKGLAGFLCMFACAAMLLSVPVACGSKVSQSNFEKIQTGMTLEEVQAILGPPTESSGVAIGGLSGSSSIWKSEEGNISIQFFNGEVRAKTFSSAGE